MHLAYAISLFPFFLQWYIFSYSRETVAVLWCVETREMCGHWQASPAGDLWMPGCLVKASVSSQRSPTTQNGLMI